MFMSLGSALFVDRVVGEVHHPAARVVAPGFRWPGSEILAPKPLQLGANCVTSRAYKERHIPGDRMLWSVSKVHSSLAS